VIEWLAGPDFVALFESEYRPDGRFLTEEHDLDVPLVDLRARVSMSPIFTPASDGDQFPGPVERWYGRVAGHLFLLTHSYEQSGRMTILTIEPSPGAREAVQPAIQTLIKTNPYSTPRRS
jgi:hypothetical protein